MQRPWHNQTEHRVQEEALESSTVQGTHCVDGYWPHFALKSHIWLILLWVVWL